MPRRHTLHVVAVLAVLAEGDSTWAASDLADRCELSYGSAYAVLQRLFRTGLVARIETGGEGEAIGHTRVWWDLSDAGKRLHRELKRHAADAVGLLKAALIEEDDDEDVD